MSLARLSRLDKDGQDLADDFEKNKKDWDSEREEGWKTGFLDILRSVVAVAEDAHRDEDPGLGEILTMAENVLNSVITSASNSCSSLECYLFEPLDVFCHSVERPLLQFKRPEGVFCEHSFSI